MAKQSRITTSGFTGNTANPAKAHAMTELRRSGAAGKHPDGRNRRARTRSTQTSRALRDFA